MNAASICNRLLLIKPTRIALAESTATASFWNCVSHAIVTESSIPGCWQGKYRRFSKLKADPIYRACFTYLDYDYRIRNMIYTTNWIERLNKDFRRVLKVRNSMPDEDSVITLLGHVAMNKRAYNRKVPKLNHEERLFSHSSHGNNG